MFYILPHQLYHTIPQLFEDDELVVLWEHPFYFSRMSFNKKKILLHRHSMKEFAASLSRKSVKVKYVDHSESHQFPETDFRMLDPIDRIPLPKYAKLLENPGFLLSTNDLKDIDTVRFTTGFYPRIQEKANFLIGQKSQDKHNRQPFPTNKQSELPALPTLKMDLEESIKYVNANFKTHPGTTDDFVYPTTRKHALLWLNDFLKNRLSEFGPFQDAMVRGESYMYHSVLSSSLNIGLITPSDVVIRLKKYARRAPLQSVEGFFRQLAWREFQRYCYKSSKIHSALSPPASFFGGKGALTREWYTGTTGLPPVDECIKKAFLTGYLHHIERLMLMGNIMTLKALSPVAIHKWFMEFSIDSYEWVMFQNVYDMVCFNGDGMTTRKPYFTKSNYILKMSNYDHGAWSVLWDKLYSAFLKTHKKKLYKYRYHFRLS